MSLNIDKYKNDLKKVYEQAVDIIKIRKDFYEIELPLFLNTGDVVDIQLSIKNEKNIILKNELYKIVEKRISEKVNNINLKKDYFLNEEKFINLKNSLKENNIEINLLLEKNIQNKEFEEKFVEEIFKYSFEVIRYYNYIYDYLVENLRGEIQSKIFNNEIKNFVESFNKKIKRNDLKMKEILKDEEDLISNYNSYYKTKNKIITGINSKVHLLEAIKDIEKIKKKDKDVQTYILIDQKKKSDLSDKYIEKMFKDEILNKIKYFGVTKEEDLYDFEKILLEKILK
ncbi:MAG: hypothetical protein ACRC4T_17150 [Cetobacterium sp.]